MQARSRGDEDVDVPYLDLLQDAHVDACNSASRSWVMLKVTHSRRTAAPKR